MAMNTPYISANTSSQSNINTPYVGVGGRGLTGVTSDLSVPGTLFVNAIVNRSGTTGTSGNFSSNVSIGGTLAVGGGLAIQRISQLTFSTATITAAGAESTESALPFAGLGVNDVILVGPPSALSTALTVSAYCSSAGTVTVRWSNSSTVAKTVAQSQIYRLTAIEYA